MKRSILRSFINSDVKFDVNSDVDLEVKLKVNSEGNPDANPDVIPEVDLCIDSDAIKSNEKRYETSYTNCNLLLCVAVFMRRCNTQPHRTWCLHNAPAGADRIRSSSSQVDRCRQNDRIGTQALEVATLGFSARGARTMSRLDCLTGVDSFVFRK